MKFKINDIEFDHDEKENILIMQDVCGFVNIIDDFILNINHSVISIMDKNNKPKYIECKSDKCKNDYVFLHRKFEEIGKKKPLITKDGVSFKFTKKS